MGSRRGCLPVSRAGGPRRGGRGALRAGRGALRGGRRALRGGRGAVSRGSRGASRGPRAEVCSKSADHQRFFDTPLAAAPRCARNALTISAFPTHPPAAARGRAARRGPTSRSGRPLPTGVVTGPRAARPHVAEREAASDRRGNRTPRGAAPRRGAGGRFRPAWYPHAGTSPGRTRPAPVGSSRG